MPKSQHKPLALRTRAELYTQLGTMETAGLPFDNALGLLRLPLTDQSRVQMMRNLLKKGIEPAFAGEKSGLFTSLEASFLHAAFSAGSPAATFHRLGKYYTQRALQMMAIKSRLTLPTFVLITAFFVQPLPKLITGSLNAGGYLVQCFGPLAALAGMVYLAVALPHWFRSGPLTQTRLWIDAQLLRIPLFGVIHARSNVRDFFESLALMLEAGMPILDALPKALNTIHNRVIKQAFAQIKPKIEQGSTLMQAIPDLTWIQDNQVIEHIRTGEASGTLPEMLFRYTAIETNSIHHFHQQVADWAPRLLYGLVMCWVAYGILSSRQLGLPVGQG